MTRCVSSYTPQNIQTALQNLSPELQRIQDYDNGDRQACYQIFLENKAVCKSYSSVIVDYNTYRHANIGGVYLTISKIYGIQEEANRFGLNIDTNSVEANKISFRYAIKACFLGDMEACSHLERIKINLEQMK